MRDLPNKLISRDRFRRRQALAILLISATPALAKPPTLVMPQAIPFGPTVSHGSAQNVQSNPFCVAPAQGPVDSIQLASGASKSSIRLKPIGKAIGLKSMDDQSGEADSPSDASTEAMTIESVPAQIRQNPLIDSTHQENNPLVETELVEANRASSKAGANRSSTIVLRSVRPIVPMSEPTIETSRDDVRPLPHHPVESAATNDSALVESTTASDSKNETEAEPEAPPVHFSFSDREDTIDSDDADIETSESVADAMAAHQLQMDSPIDLSPAPSTSDSVASNDQNIVARQEPTNQQSRSIVAPPVIAPAAIEPRQARRAAIITAPARPAKLDPRAKRYRPPVAVKPVPLTIERAQADEGNPATVQPVPQFDPQTIALVGAVDIKRVTLHMNLADVRTLTIDSHLHGARVADHAVCKVVQAGANQLKLIGTGEGSTELFVVADGQISGQAPRRQVFEIHVSDKTDRTGVALAETASLLNRSIAETFPTCQVLVRQRASELIVAGRCDSQTSAKKILRMIRKTCLVPVRDELIVP